MLSEMLVDWLKHAFITKFNHIRPSVYERYKDVLCRDLASGSAVGRRGARKASLINIQVYEIILILYDSTPMLINRRSSRVVWASHPFPWLF